jgi:hypothetical protein
VRTRRTDVTSTTWQSGDPLRLRAARVNASSPERFTGELRCGLAPSPLTQGRVDASEGKVVACSGQLPRPPLDRSARVGQCEYSGDACMIGAFLNDISPGSNVTSSPNKTAASRAAPFTALQGQYLSFIHAYEVIHGCAPAEADLQRHFAVTPPSVHQMILTLERKGLIRRVAGAARSITLRFLPRNSRHSSAENSRLRLANRRNIARSNRDTRRSERNPHRRHGRSASLSRSRMPRSSTSIVR